jgi:hypothetical protein
MKYFTTLIFISSTFILRAATYEVGPGKTYTSILQVSTHNLQPGDSIKVFYKPTPYYEKFLLHGVGTSSNTIILIGIADANGKRPVIDGNNALSNQSSSYWNEDRQVILIGQAGSVESDFIIVDGFEIRGANDFNTFTDDSGNSNLSYSENSAGVRVSWGKNITIRNCDITDNGNGIQSGDEDNMNLVIEYCNVFDNGKSTSNTVYIHNFYLSSGENSTVTLQYCHIGELLSNGQQIRSRAHTTVVRYNWIEGGRNSSLDLMQGSGLDVNLAHDAYVYGNVIVKPDNSENSRIIHFGSDNNGYDRLGTCYFYNNTCVIKDTKTSGTRRIFVPSSNSATVIADNNIFHKADAVTYELNIGTGNFTGSDNWFSTNINGINALTNSLTGAAPDFIDYNNGDYHLNFSSPCANIIASYSYPTNYSLTNQYVIHAQSMTRPINGDIDLGAFEIEMVSQLHENQLSSLKVYPNPTLGKVNIDGLEISEIKLFDINGRLINVYQSTSSIDISSLPKGIYTLELMANTNLVTAKIIKE